MKKIDRYNWAILQTIVFLKAAMQVQQKDYNNLVEFGAMGQCRVNNDFGRGHEAYASQGCVKHVTNKRKGTVEKKYVDMGSFHMLHPKLQDSLLQTARKMERNTELDLMLN